MKAAMTKREKFRKTVVRELFILAVFAALSTVVLAQSFWVLKGLEKQEIYWSNARSLPENLAALGLASSEINAVLMMEEFKKDYPQYAEAGYNDAVGFYLSEFPAYPHREALYERITAAESKINEAKRKLADARRIEKLSPSLTKSAFLILALSPITCAARCALR